MKVDPSAFEARVRERIKAAAEQQLNQPLSRLSPWLRAAAALLPLEVLAGCKPAGTTATAIPVGGMYKIAAYAAFPAISRGLPMRQASAPFDAV